jgi:general secretion pathway protein G
LTLIEILIVIAILLAIGGLVVVNLMPKKEQADIDLMRVQIGSFDEALKLFKLDMDRYPTEEEGLAALWKGPEDDEETKKWRGPYMDPPVPQDKWGHDWIYRYPGEIRGEAYYDIVSIGPDGEEGSEDDISNHDRLLNAEGEVGEEFDTFTPADVGSGG